MKATHIRKSPLILLVQNCDITRVPDEIVDVPHLDVDLNGNRLVTPFDLLFKYGEYKSLYWFACGMRTRNKM